MHQRTVGYALALVSVAALSVPGQTRAQGTFEGMVAGTMALPNGMVAPFRYYQLGSRTRQEYTIEGHTGAMIFDGTARFLFWRLVAWNRRQLAVGTLHLQLTTGI
jgi:hypothetical protein